MVKGNRGRGHLFQGNKGQILVEQRQHWGTENIRKSEQGTGPAIYLSGAREQPPLPWEGLTYLVGLSTMALDLRSSERSLGRDSPETAA